VNLEKIPSLFIWIRNNWITFVSVCVCLLAFYGVYQFIDGYAKPFGQAIATQHQDLKRAVASYTALDAILTKELQKYRGSRVGLFRFHDSEHDVTRTAFFFVSVANMVAAPGVAVDLPSITNLPASTFAPILPDLISHKSFFSMVKDLEPGGLKELETKRGSKAILYVPIDDLSDNLIGFITIAWLSDEDVPGGPDREAMINSLESDSIRISGYFNLSSIND
jgi:hypothetical protein